MMPGRFARGGGVVLRFAALLAAVLLVYAAPSASGGLRAPPSLGPTPIEIAATPFTDFEVRDPSRRQFGPLTFRGGLVLSSPAREFGGVSSIRIERDGQRFLAVTDKGFWLRGRIRYEDGRPAGIADAEMAPMLGPDGRPIVARRWYDAESLATDGQVAYVGLERVHQILKFDIGRHGLSARGSPIAVPAELKRLPANKGIEGLLLGPAGTPLAETLVAFSERGLDEAGNIRGFLIGGKHRGAFSVSRSLDFDITDADATPREVFILERKFSFLTGPGMRIRRLPLAALRPGALVAGTSLIAVDAGYQIDNMEGLSVHEGPKGEIVLTLVSDDNFSILQRTLLLQFTLAEP